MFDSNSRNIVKYIFIILGAYMLINMISSGELFAKILILPGLIIALTVHEFSHARAADKLGDPTPERQGRLTLNPLAHMDIAGTVCLLFAGFGWGKPVQINSSYFRNPSKDEMLVALAGPLSNLILAFISFITYGFLYYLVPQNTEWGRLLITLIINCAYINLTLGVFNLLPFPPLDGSKILRHFLTGKAKEFLWKLEDYSYIIITILFITEIPSILIRPIVSTLANWMIFIASKILELIF